jgi:hypothetical protein
MKNWKPLVKLAVQAALFVLDAWCASKQARPPKKR